MFKFVDERDQTHTKELKLTISTIHTFRHCIGRILQAWDDFESQDIRFFLLPPTDDRYRHRWETHLSGVRRYVRELRQYQLLLNQRLELFKAIEGSVRR
jgi:hypothetical protein